MTGVNPIGSECMFAHHAYELKFSQELKEKRRILKDVLKKVNLQLSGDVRKAAWNPGGGTFSDCIGCGENVFKNVYNSWGAKEIKVYVVLARCENKISNASLPTEVKQEKPKTRLLLRGIF